MSSRAYRKATSFASFGGHQFRLTTKFKTDLSALIGYAEALSPSDTVNVRTTDGSTPMTLNELYQLRATIAKQESDALGNEAVA